CGRAGAPGPGTGGVGRVGAGHRLDDDRGAAADLHRARAAADADADGTMHANHGHGNTWPAPRAAAARPELSSVSKHVQPDEMLDDRPRLRRRIDEGEPRDIGD